LLLTVSVVHQVDIVINLYIYVYAAYHLQFSMYAVV